MSELVNAARDYLADGLSVVPTFGKAAYSWKPFIDRLPTAGELAQSFSPNGHGPSTGLALVVGSATWARHPYMYVLDIEAPYRLEAEPWLDQHIPRWRTGRVAESGGGGLHLYLRAAAPVATHRHAWGEVRGGGSITVLPPSAHQSGGRYRWRNQGELLDVDADSLPIPGVRRERRDYESLAESDILEGARNATLTSLGGLLRHAGLHIDTIYSTLAFVNQERCEPPLDQQDVLNIARSIGRYEPATTSPGLTSHQGGPPLQVRLQKRAASEVLADNPTGATLESLPLLGLEGYIIVGWGHILAGYPKAGKTELLASCVRRWLEDGLTVHWLTEESESVWAQRLARWPYVPDGLFLTFGLGSDAMTLLNHAAGGNEDVVILDTIRNLLGLVDENDNAAISRALVPWEAGLRGRTRVYVHHDRKAGGDHGHSIAGGGAFLGVVDRALEVKFDSQSNQRRRIEIRSRIVEAPDLAYEMTDAGDLIALGDPSALALDAVRERLGAVLGPEWAKTRELQQALPEPRPSIEQVRQALLAMAESGEAERNPPICEEAKGHTVRWRQAAPP